MERPAPDLLNDYLEGLELLEALREKRRAYGDLGSEERWKGSVEGGEEGRRLEEFVEEQIRRVEMLLAEYERGMESVLHAVADREDSGRVLFESVRAAIEEVRHWSAQDWAELPSEAAEEWNRLLRDFADIQCVWDRRLPRRSGGPG